MVCSSIQWQSEHSDELGITSGPALFVRPRALDVMYGPKTSGASPNGIWAAANELTLLEHCPMSCAVIAYSRATVLSVGWVHEYVMNAAKFPRK